MRRATRTMLAICAAGACSIGIAVTAQASADGKVLICHGTTSEPNPYVLISVDASALAGHFDGSGPGHGPRNAPDFLPGAGATDCSGGGGSE